MKCSVSSTCSNPKINDWGNDIFCLNCYQSYKKSENISKKVDKYQCCETPNIVFTDLYDYCTNCGVIHEKIVNELPYLENDSYQTNILYKSKKVHVPYKYLRFNYPEIKYEQIYDFILKAIQFIQDYYKLKRKPYSKYISYLYNFYKDNIPNVPIIEQFQNNKDLILEQDIIDKLYELLNIKTKKLKQIK